MQQQQPSSCSGHGSCIPASTHCSCDEDYYLKDCSLSKSDYDNYLQTKKDLYDRANALKGTSSSQALNEQLIKSINLLLEDGDLGLLLSPQDVNSGLNDMDTIITSQLNQLDSLEQEGLSSDGDSQLTKSSQESNQMLGKAMDFLDKMYDSVQTNAQSERRRRAMFTSQELDSSNKRIYQLSQKVNSGL